jgi:release factor glutamine methyltransferase
VTTTPGGGLQRFDATSTHGPGTGAVHVRPLRTALLDAERRLGSAGVPSPRTDAELLAAHVLGVPRGRLMLSDGLTTSQSIKYESLLTRRIARVPLQHLVGAAPFRDLEVRVGPGVLIPRPETELVAEAALRFLASVPRDEHGRQTAVDLCSGSGALAFSLATESRGCDVVALELSAEAQVWARSNLERVTPRAAEVDSSVLLRDGDVLGAALDGGPLADLVGRVDVVVSNPPYIPEGAVPRDPEVADYDPPVALFGGPDGLDVVRGVADTAARLLRRGGLVVIEHGDTQGDGAGEYSVPDLLRGWPDPLDESMAAFAEVQDRTDLARRPRFTTAIRVGTAP